MAGTLVVGAEGVLLVPEHAAYGSSQPIQDGLDLVAALRRGMVLGRIVVLAHTKDAERAQFWLKINGLSGVDVRIPPPIDYEELPAVAQLHQIDFIRSQGPVWMVITSHYSVAQHCERSHQAVLCFGRRGALSALEEPLSWDSVSRRSRRERESVARAESDDIYFE